MDKPTVRVCRTCGGQKRIGAGRQEFDCGDCSGTGQVIGVPEGQIVVADGTTKRVRTFPKITVGGARIQLVAHLNFIDNARISPGDDSFWAANAEPAAVANMIMQEPGDV